MLYRQRTRWGKIKRARVSGVYRILSHQGPYIVAVLEYPATDLFLLSLSRA
jgi:hypothetical protein